jgi:hypothetical protein
MILVGIKLRKQNRGDSKRQPDRSTKHIRLTPIVRLPSYFQPGCLQDTSSGPSSNRVVGGCVAS